MKQTDKSGPFHKGIIFIAVLLLGSSAPGYSLVFDLRTRLEEKVEFAPIKNGAMYFLFDSVSFTVKITEPTSVYEKRALAKQKVSLTYHPGKPETMTTDEAATRFLRKRIARLSKQVEAEAIMGGRLVKNTVEELLEKNK